MKKEGCTGINQNVSATLRQQLLVEMTFNVAKPM